MTTQQQLIAHTPKHTSFGICERVSECVCGLNSRMNGCSTDGEDHGRREGDRLRNSWLSRVPSPLPICWEEVGGCGVGGGPLVRAPPSGRP
jgi:hypothetical protein